jgi:hypothetical protein
LPDHGNRGAPQWRSAERHLPARVAVPSIFCTSVEFRARLIPWIMFPTFLR